MKSLLYCSILLLLPLVGMAQNQAKRLAAFNLENKQAIQGYDPVAYFKQGKAIKGKKEFAVSYEGLLYNFATADNKAAFMQNAAAYEPQYGGWCAYAMGQNGEKVAINPETFKILDGKLYLFYNAYFNNTLKSWNKEERNLKTKADQNWKKFF